MSLLRSESILGPWMKVSTFDHSGGPTGVWEDPSLWTDTNGNFHAFYHIYDVSADKSQCIDSTVSGHTYSLNGYDWFTSDNQPYNTQLEIVGTNGELEVITLSTRERPRFFVDAKSGNPTHLINGVCEASVCPEVETGCVDCKYTYPDFTLIAALDV